MKKFTLIFSFFLALIMLTMTAFANNDKPIVAPDSYLKDAIIYNLNQKENVKIDLYVMSQCPYGVKAEEALVPILKEMGNKVEFNIFFIANVKGNNEFQALHGEPEVMENRRQLVIARHYSDKFYDYLIERAKDYRKDDWTNAGKTVGLDINKVNTLVQSQTEIDVFTRNVTFGNIKKIYGSPSLFINGKQYHGSYAEKQKSLRKAQEAPGTCSGGSDDGNTCDTDNGDAGCANECIGGSNTGNHCNSTSNCPDACINGPDDGNECPPGGCRGNCFGGSTAGNACEDDGDCDDACSNGPDIGNFCEDDNDCTNECVGGQVNNGLQCGHDAACHGCVGGQTPNAGCTQDSDCGKVCDGGPNDGQNCNSNLDCPGECAAGPDMGNSCTSDINCSKVCDGTNTGCVTSIDCNPGVACVNVACEGSCPTVSCDQTGTCDIGTCGDVGDCTGYGVCGDIGYCDIGTCVPDVLPVELANFKAFVQQNNTVLLRWTTLSEENNEKFEIQRSRDGKTWETIDFVEGHGQSVERIDYDWTDETVEAGINYYRLKQFDFDGKFEIHKTVSIEITSTSGLIVQAFPNPTSGVSTLYIPSNIEGKVIIYVVNTAGKPVKIIRQNIQMGKNLIFLDLNELGIGFYHIAVEHEGELKVKSDIMVTD
ncbi:MAG: hypothetical protein AB8G11_25290 [Saprospiraceae bacterium]